MSASFNADDIRSFVSSMAINVISCFEVKPRRRRDEEGVIDDRKAFRLRIRADDQDRLLNANKWPSSIAISEWFFKQPSQATSDNRRRRLVDEDDGAADGAVGGRPQSANSAADMDTEQTVLLDMTVIGSHINDGGKNICKDSSQSKDLTLLCPLTCVALIRVTLPFRR